MTGYLKRLIKRNMGVADVIAPRPRARFEPYPPGGENGSMSQEYASVKANTPAGQEDLVLQPDSLTTPRMGNQDMRPNDLPAPTANGREVGTQSKGGFDQSEKQSGPTARSVPKAAELELQRDPVESLAPESAVDTQSTAADASRTGMQHSEAPPPLQNSAKPLSRGGHGPVVRVTSTTASSTMGSKDLPMEISNQEPIGSSSLSPLSIRSKEGHAVFFNKMQDEPAQSLVDQVNAGSAHIQHDRGKAAHHKAHSTGQAATSPPVSSGDVATGPPAVHVTIGRIEVRAVTTKPSAASSEASIAYKPAYALSDYLQKRRGGQP